MLACIFAASGTAKLFDLPKFEGILSAAKLGRFGAGPTYALVICMFELGLAAGLAAGVVATAMAWIAVAFLVVATLVVIRLRRIGYDKGCNCFGEFSERMGSPLWRNALLLGAAMLDGVLEAYCPRLPLWMTGGTRATLLAAGPIGTAIVVAVCTQIAAPRTAAPGI